MRHDDEFFSRDPSVRRGPLRNETHGDDLGLLEHPAPNLEPGDVVVVADGWEAVVTARVDVEPGPGPLVAMLEVVLAPSRLEVDDALP